MDTLQNLLMGFSIALTPENLLFALIGSVVGTLVGVLPGVGPAAGTAMLIPMTFHLPATGAIIMLAAIFYGSQYGGTITTVLLSVPGEASSVVTLIDGHQMAVKGRAGVALSIAAIASFIGGTVATIGLVLAAPPLALAALQFGPPEYFALLVLGLSLVIALGGKSIVRALIMGVFGMLLSLVGMDSVQGVPRFTFDQPDLLDGMEFVPVIMGLFGISDILVNAEGQVQQMLEAKMKSLVPTTQDLKDSAWPIARGTVMGFLLGLFPGMNSTVSTFMSYILEKRMSKYPEKFGTGVIEGVAGPETANNSHANAALIPLFTLGIPGSPTVAVLMTAFIINGLVPGPLLFKERPDVVWAIIASMYIGNAILLVLNLPLIGLWVQILKIPYAILFAFVLTFTVIGSYSINNSVFDVWVMLVFGALGYAFRKLDMPVAPAVLTFILAPMIEKALWRSTAMFQGDITGFLERPIAVSVLALTVLILVSFGLQSLRVRSAVLSRGDAET